MFDATKRCDDERGEVTFAIRTRCRCKNAITVVVADCRSSCDHENPAARYTHVRVGRRRTEVLESGLTSPGAVNVVDTFAPCEW